MKRKAPIGLRLSIRQTRIRMLERGLDAPALARRIGFRYHHVVNVLAGNTKSWPVMKAINCAFKEKIFARPRRIRRRREQVSAL